MIGFVRFSLNCIALHCIAFAFAFAFAFALHCRPSHSCAVAQVLHCTVATQLPAA